MFVERLKRGFPLKPPTSLATGFLLTGSGLETVVFDIIWTKRKMIKHKIKIKNLILKKKKKKKTQ